MGVMSGEKTTSHTNATAAREKDEDAFDASEETYAIPLVTSAPAVDVTEPPLPGDRYLDREISWLAFNERVLELAEDPATPLLERAFFLAIFASNLDEFFMVRVAGLKRRIAAGFAVPSATGMSPTRLVNVLRVDARYALSTVKYARRVKKSVA